MTKIEKEAKLYENVSTKKLKRVILGYKFLSFSNSKIFNFLFSFLFLLVPYFILFKFNTFSFSLIVILHYLIFWRYFYLHKNIKMVSDDEKYDIDEIIKILKTYLNKRKNPLK